MWFSFPKNQNRRIGLWNLVNLENVFKVAYYWLSMMFQCFCQHVSTDGICQLSYRFCQTKHRTLGLLLSGQYIWTIFFEHTPPTGSLWVWKDVFCSYLNSYSGRVSAEETSTSMETKFWTYKQFLYHNIAPYINIP